MEVARESIFISSLRSFCKVFFSVIGFAVSLILIGIVYSLFSSPFLPEPKTDIEILPDLNGKQEMAPLTAPVVLRLDIEGVIGIPDVLTAEIIENILLDSRKGILQGDRVKAILLYLDTPGGTVTDSDTIYRMLLQYKEKYKVPIYAFMDGLCASGGMYVSSAADKSFATTSTIVGSIGVLYGPLFNFSEAMTKLGIQSMTITKGLDKDALSPFRPWKPDEADSMKKITDFLYQRFVTVATNARPRLNREKLIAEYGANVFDCVDAQEKGYIDVANADYHTALFELMQAAQIDPEKPYQVVTLKAKPDIFRTLAHSSLIQGKIEHVLQLNEMQKSRTHDPFSYLYMP